MFIVLFGREMFTVLVCEKRAHLALFKFISFQLIQCTMVLLIQGSSIRQYRQQFN